MLAIMVQYWDKVEQKLVTELFYVVEWKDASAGGLSRAIIDKLAFDEIPTEQ